MHKLVGVMVGQVKYFIQPIQSQDLPTQTAQSNPLFVFQKASAALMIPNY